MIRYSVSAGPFYQLQKFMSISPEVQPDDWSDEDEDQEKTDPVRRIKTLEQKLALAKQSLNECRAFVAKKLDLGGSLDAPLLPEPSKADTLVRDDDTHYFKSYAENGRIKNHDFFRYMSNISLFQTYMPL